jgi:hypothetical protein
MMMKSKTVPNKKGNRMSVADGSVTIQTSSDSVPSTPPWFGESHPTRNPTVGQSHNRFIEDI